MFFWILMNWLEYYDALVELYLQSTRMRSSHYDIIYNFSSIFHDEYFFFSVDKGFICVRGPFVHGSIRLNFEISIWIRLNFEKYDYFAKIEIFPKNERSKILDRSVNRQFYYVFFDRSLNWFLYSQWLRFNDQNEKNKFFSKNEICKKKEICKKNVKR